MYLAPILLFVYNRPAHTRRLLDSLRQNEEAKFSTLYIYSDAPRSEQDAAQVEAVRQYIHSPEAQQGFQQVHIIEREQNFGLAQSIITGVTERVEEWGSVIVLEDDLILSPYFLSFMNSALERYEDVMTVGHIQACDFTGDPDLPICFFIRWAGSWGWGTWKRAWQLFEPDGQKLLDILEKRGLTREFDFNGAYPFTRMLRRQIRGENNSWAIRWNASLFVKGILSLNVGRSLVSNAGFDGTGTHCEAATSLYQAALSPVPIEIPPMPIRESPLARHIFESYYRRTNSLWARGKRRLQQILARWR